MYIGILSEVGEA